MEKNKLNMILNIILIVILILIGLYVWFNVEHLKSLGGDVCRLCEEKTGGICTTTGYPSTLGKVEINLSQMEGFDEGKDK
jgi:hypothetical protein